MHKHDKQKKNPETGHTALVKRTNCDISETALPITETKKTKTLCNMKYPPKTWEILWLLFIFTKSQHVFMKKHRKVSLWTL